jgi:hypothetical protein
LNGICEQFVHDERERYGNIVGDSERKGVNNEFPGVYPDLTKIE